jgi:hypothetical protein
VTKIKRDETNWPTGPLSAAEEAELRRQRIEDEPPIGMRPDGTLEFWTPGTPKPQPVVIVDSADEDPS